MERKKTPQNTGEWNKDLERGKACKYFGAEKNLLRTEMWEGMLKKIKITVKNDCRRE